MNLWARLGIGNKVLVLFVAVTVVPLVILTFVWLRFSQSQLELAAADRQRLLITSIAQRADSFLNESIESLVSRSQNPDVANLNVDDAKINLLQYAAQENHVDKIILADNTGKELVKVNNGLLDENLGSVANADAFKVVTLIGNKPRLGEVGEHDGRPMITISVPLLPFGELENQELTSNESLIRRYGGDIVGALIVDVDLSSLWRAVENTKLGDEGYMYLVDKRGDILTHADPALAASRQSLTDVVEVQDALKVLSVFDIDSAVAEYVPDPEVSLSETGASVLSSNFPIASTQWALIGQEPVSSVFSAANRVSVIAAIILSVSVPVSILLVVLATRTVITPIRQLTAGALKLSSGDFTSRFDVRGNDELAVMARTFNTMAYNLHSLLDRLQTQNIHLVAEQNKLHGILDTIADGVLVLDNEFRIVLANKMVLALSGQELDGVVGKGWLEVLRLYYEDEDFTNDRFTKELEVFQNISMLLGDEQKFLDITALHLSNDPSGIAFIMTIQDTTERRELENMKLDFVSMAAHELRTPLTAINGYLNLMASNDADENDRSNFVGLASANASMLEGLINNMLSLSRIERGALTINREKLDWNNVIREEVANFTFAANAKHIDISVELPEGSLYVSGDKISLREVLGNLINNAIHYSDDGQPIKLKVELLEDRIKTTISDSGIGIPERVQNKLFRKYFRAKGGLTTNSQGTGIGLFISKSIIEAHGGEIGVSSEFGHGSDFYFVLDEYSENENRQGDNNSGTIKHINKVKWFEEDTDS